MKLIYEKSQTGRRASAIPRPEGLPPAEVPEPSTLILLGSALALLTVRKLQLVH